MNEVLFDEKQVEAMRAHAEALIASEAANHRLMNAVTAGEQLRRDADLACAEKVRRLNDLYKALGMEPS